MTRTENPKTRRELRKTLGTRTSRRRGTKSKAIPGTAGPRLILCKYRFARRVRNRTRPSVALEALLRKAG